MREKHLRSRHFLSLPGITPASAGKTDCSINFRTSAQDHPRECGKNDISTTATGWALGSPPRVREKQSDYVAILFGLRITPASAGKTLPTRHRYSSNWDHPHECGKNSTLRNTTWPITGSPQRVREKPQGFLTNL